MFGLAVIVFYSVVSPLCVLLGALYRNKRSFDVHLLFPSINFIMTSHRRVHTLHFLLFYEIRLLHYTTLLLILFYFFTLLLWLFSIYYRIKVTLKFLEVLPDALLG